LFWRCSRRIPASLVFWAVFRSTHKNRDCSLLLCLSCDLVSLQ
jgi:hypothetical protein